MYPDISDERNSYWNYRDQKQVVFKIEIKELEQPTPKEYEVLVKVCAASVNYNTLVHVQGKPLLARLWTGLRKPKYQIPGNDIAGRVEAVGRMVSRFQPGDEVFGDLFNYGRGAFAEYVCVPESAVIPKPATLSIVEAAAVPEAALVALQALRDKGNIKSGQHVLICGASGGIGTFAVQIAKSFGAEVTGVCSARNLDLVQSLGADHVIDYTREDFSRQGPRYDLIVATAGYRPIFDYKRALKPVGVYVATGGSMKQIFQAQLLGPWISMGGRRKLTGLTLQPNKYLIFMKELIEAGKVKPVIDRCYPFIKAAEALRYYGEGKTRGKVVLTFKSVV